jgi:hypothetical protein
MDHNPGDPILRNPERVAEIAIRAFGRAKDAAIAELERRGIPIYGTTEDGKITVRRPRKRRKLCAEARRRMGHDVLTGRAPPKAGSGSSRTLPGGQKETYRSQKTVKVDGHLGHVGSLQEVRETRCAEDVPTCAERHVHRRGPSEGRR